MNCPLNVRHHNAPRLVTINVTGETQLEDNQDRQVAKVGGVPQNGSVAMPLLISGSLLPSNIAEDLSTPRICESSETAGVVQPEVGVTGRNESIVSLENHVKPCISAERILSPNTSVRTSVTSEHLVPMTSVCTSVTSEQLLPNTSVRTSVTSEHSQGGFRITSWGLGKGIAQEGPHWKYRRLIELQGIIKGFPAQILVDSGASGDCLASSFVQ
jgi:hypothetical protein